MDGWMDEWFSQSTTHSLTQSINRSLHNSFKCNLILVDNRVRLSTVERKKTDYSKKRPTPSSWVNKSTKGINFIKIYRNKNKPNGGHSGPGQHIIQQKLPQIPPSRPGQKIRRRRRTRGIRRGRRIIIIHLTATATSAAAATKATTTTPHNTIKKWAKGTKEKTNIAAPP